MSKFLKVFGFIAFIFSFASAQLFHQDPNMIERFEIWIKIHKIQANDDSHLVHIFENWLSNDKFISLTNAKNLSYTVGHNAFSGMNSEEFEQFMGFRSNQDLLIKEDVFLRGSVPIIKQNIFFDVEGLPSSVDWRTKNAVTDVKDQGNCGSCYSFSSTGALEGIYAITHNNLVSFSEQEIVDCDNGLTKAHACNGGIMNQVFDFISKNEGLCTEQDYPYKSGTTQKAGTCQTSCKSVSGSKISKHTDVLPNSDNAMMTALTQQPVSVAIQANQKEFQMYKSGVFTANCNTDLDHGVLLIGYGTQNGQDYYILKNSWGNLWGMSGYLLIGKGNDPATGKPYNNGAGQCGVLGMASYPSL